MLERDFQADLIKEIKRMFPGCIVSKSDPCYTQGLPDLFIFWNDKWAALECKRNRGAKKQPNQVFYVEKLNGMSFARFIYPENKEEILYELQQAFKS